MESSSKANPPEPEDLPAFESTLRSIFESREIRDKRLFELLKSEDDLVSVVLRSHLVIEELLFSAIAAHCEEPDRLRDAH